MKTSEKVEVKDLKSVKGGARRKVKRAGCSLRRRRRAGGG